MYIYVQLGGGFKYFFNVHPYLGKFPILTNIFQMGWNHQPDKYVHIAQLTYPQYIILIIDSFGGSTVLNQGLQTWVSSSSGNLPKMVAKVSR